MEMKTLFLVVATGTICYVAGRNHKLIKTGIKSVVNKFKESDLYNSQSEDNIVKQEEQSNQTKNIEFDIVQAKEEFISVADKFEEIYEALYVVAQKENHDAEKDLKDWCTRVKYLNNKPHFQLFWNENKTNLQNVIEFMFSCGVVRDNLKQITATQSTILRYLSSEPIEIGKEYKVLSPCWTLGNKVINKGILNNA